MKKKESAINSFLTITDLIRYFILIFWLLFWFLNVIDKIIGGPHFLFVGKDRFAQIERFFDSIGLGGQSIADIALILTAGLESFAFVFFCGALYHFRKKNFEATRSWFVTGIALSLITFTYFTVGDQIFGDHSELLEHALFWFICLLSWILFVQVEKIEIVNRYLISKRQSRVAIIFLLVLGGITTLTIFWHHLTSFVERTQAVESIKVTENLYKIQFPFLAGSKAFERSIAKFKKEHPEERITFIYTVPPSLKLGQSEGLIIYIKTEKK